MSKTQKGKNMYLSPISYQTNIRKQNHNFNFKGIETKVAEEVVTNVAKKAALPTTAAALAVIGIKTASSNSTVPQKRSIEERLKDAREKLETSGFSNSISPLRFDSLPFFTGENFENIVNDMIATHQEVENGQQPTAEFVDTKVSEIMSKYNLPKEVKGYLGHVYNLSNEIRDLFLNDWKYRADIQMSQGVPKSEISPTDLRRSREVKPDEAVLSRFDDLLTRVGDPIKVEHFRGTGVHTYLNKYGNEINVTTNGRGSVTETLNLDEPGIIHRIKKEYKLSSCDFDYLVNLMNGAKCGSRGEDMSGIEEYTKIGDDSETVKYDEYGIKISEVNKEKKDDVETEHKVVYAADGSIITDTTSKTYLK